MDIERAKILRLFGDIERRDDENRTVSGYCYTSAECGDGWNVPRDVMERLGSTYVGNIREMHTHSAVGKVEELTWDDKGCMIRVKVVDPVAWDKVSEGVYRGFSIGILPKKVARSKSAKTLIDGIWNETSLVDTPADKGALFLSRIEDIDEVDCEVEVEAEEVERGEFADRFEAQEKSSFRYRAMDCLGCLLWEIQDSTGDDKETRARAAIAEFSDYVAPQLARGEFMREDTEVARAESMAYEIEEAKNEVARLATELSANALEIERLNARIAELEKEPDPTQGKPMRFVGKDVLNRLRDVAQVKSEQDNDEIRREAQAIISTDWTNKSDKEKADALLRLSELKSRIV